MRLSRYGVWAVARYEQVHAVLNDWQSFRSSRGVGITDFAREKSWRPKSLLLESDPPLHDRARHILNRVLSASVMSRLRERLRRTGLSTNRSTAAASMGSPISPRLIR